MNILIHHMYEYEKGLRNLVLHTLDAKFLQLAESKLKKRGIDYFIQKVHDNKFNVFFGACECVNVVVSFGNKSLSEYSDEEDYILGTMLGYSELIQCRRYIARKQQNQDEKVS